MATKASADATTEREDQAVRAPCAGHATFYFCTFGMILGLFAFALFEVCIPGLNELHVQLRSASFCLLQKTEKVFCMSFESWSCSACLSNLGSWISALDPRKLF